MVGVARCGKNWDTMHTHFDPNPKLPTKLQPTWRTRPVTYVDGDWASLWPLIPQFRLEPFALGAGDGLTPQAANPYLRTVVRLPMATGGQPMPVAVVSPTYALVEHREVAMLCHRALRDAGLAANQLRCELGLSALGEWMNLRMYLPADFDFLDGGRERLALRLECFNSVDGSARLKIVFGWLRQVCSNGLVISEAHVQSSRKHVQGLNLEGVALGLSDSFAAVDRDRQRMVAWQAQDVTPSAVRRWVDDDVATSWGKQAAARVLSICQTGRDG